MGFYGTSRQNDEDTPRFEANEEHYRRIVELSPNIIIFELDGRIVLINSAGAALLGAQSPRELIGYPVLELVPEELRQRWGEQLRSTLPAPKRPASTPVESQFVRLDGEVIDVDLVIMPFEEGGRPGAQVIARDITARKRAEQALRASEQRFRTAVDFFPDVFVIYDAQRRLQFVNAAALRISGIGEQLQIGKRDEELFPPEFTSGYLPQLKRAVEKRENMAFEWKMPDSHGGRTLMVHYVPLINANGRLEQVLGITYDITDRKRWEQRLQRINRELAATRDAAVAANRAKSAFLANMSHELRTPLNAIIGYAEMLMEDAQAVENQPLGQDLARILTAARHLLALISDILDLSRVESGRISVHLEEFSVVEVLEQAAMTARPLMEHNHNRFELLCPPDIGTMYSDALKLRQVLLNLLSNAAKFTQNGRVTLEVARDQEENRSWIRFQITDTGIGMSEEQVKNLFEKFYQADSLITRKYGGTGLGLAISKAYCEALGGFISVESELHRGTVFTAHLPTDAVSTHRE